MTNGTAGNDTIYGDQSADLADTINGLAGEDILFGGDGADILTGGVDKDRLYGGAGDDQILINSAAEASASEQWYGGSGYDTVILSNGITSLSLKGLTIGSDVEAIQGGSGISMKASQLDGLTYLQTLDGAVTITDAGTINIDGMTGRPNAVYLSDLGNTFISSDALSGPDVYGGKGNDQITSFGYVYGGGGDDLLHATSGETYTYGGDGNDIIYTAGGWIYGGSGSDELHGGTGGDLFTPRNADDPTAVEKIYGGGGDDWLYVGDGAIDISSWTIEGVHYLSGGNPVSMTAAQFNGFGYFDTSWVKLTTAGAVSLAAGSGFISSLTLSDLGNSADLSSYDQSVEIYGGAKNDTIKASNGYDSLYGGAGNDALYGGDSDDWIDGGAGSDRIDGGAGYDYLDYQSATAGVSVNLSLTAAQNTRGSGSDTITGVEGLIGSAFADTLAGNVADNDIAGKAGNDVISGGVGNDTLSGGDGSDTLDGGAGDDTLDGGTGTDTASYASAVAVVSVSLAVSGAQNTGGAGIDTLIGIEGLTGSAYADILIGDSGNNTIFGGNGNDAITGGAGNDFLDGGNGADTVSYADVTSGVKLSLLYLAPQATGGGGTDTIKNFEHIIGSAFDDVLTGNDGSNILTGGDGNDLLLGGLGNDTLYGGNGIDTASYSSATTGVRVNLSTAAQQTTIGAGTDTLSSIENVIGSAYDDTLTGSGGDNVLNGGAGRDTVSYAQATSGVTVNLGLSGAQDTHGAGIDTLISIEYLTGSAFDDVITGSAQDNYIVGGMGNNTIDGASGNDTIISDRGNDILSGGGGDDVIWAGLGNDTIFGGTGRDILRAGDSKGGDVFIYKTLADSTVDRPDQIYDLSAGDKIDASAIDADVTKAGNQAFTFVSAFTGHGGEAMVAMGAPFNPALALFDVNGDGKEDMVIQLWGSGPFDQSFFVL